MPTDEIQSTLRVLVVEDSAVNQKLMFHIMQSQGFDVTVAANGQEAVDAFAEQPFDVVLMDVQMPVMDGLTATRIIRHHETGSGKSALIIAVTAGMDRESCLKAGMNDYLQKPLRADALITAIERSADGLLK